MDKIRLIEAFGAKFVISRLESEMAPDDSIMRGYEVGPWVCVVLIHPDGRRWGMIYDGLANHTKDIKELILEEMLEGAPPATPGQCYCGRTTHNQSSSPYHPPVVCPMVVIS